MGISLPAESRDWTGWSKVTIDYGLSDRLQVLGSMEYRLKSHFSESDRVGVGAGIQYRLPYSLRLDATYELHYRNRGDQGWKYRHRYHVGVQYSCRVHDWKISIRERFQQTFSNGEIQSRLRSRLKASYSPSSWRLSPYLSTEIYQPLGERDFFSVSRVRYRAGMEWSMTENSSVDFFYCLQDEPATSKNIIGLELSWSF